MGTYNTQFEITKAIFDASLSDLKLSGKNKTILLYISNGFFKDENTGEFVSKVAQTYIASQVGMGRNTVNKGIQEIEDQGIITSKRRKDNSKIYTWVALPTETAKAEIAKTNRETSIKLRNKLTDISKLTTTEILNIDRQIKDVEKCKGDRLFKIEDSPHLSLKGHFSYEINGINTKKAKQTKALISQGVNVDVAHEIQRLDDIEKCSGYVLYKNSMTKKVPVEKEDVTPIISPPDECEDDPQGFFLGSPPLDCYEDYYEEVDNTNYFEPSE